MFKSERWVYSPSVSLIDHYRFSIGAGEAGTANQSFAWQANSSLHQTRGGTSTHSWGFITVSSTPPHRMSEVWTGWPRPPLVILVFLEWLGVSQHRDKQFETCIFPSLLCCVRYNVEGLHFNFRFLMNIWVRLTNSTVVHHRPRTDRNTGVFTGPINNQPAFSLFSLLMDVFFFRRRQRSRCVRQQASPCLRRSTQAPWWRWRATRWLGSSGSSSRTNSSSRIWRWTCTGEEEASLWPFINETVSKTCLVMGGGRVGDGGVLLHSPV